MVGETEAKLTGNPELAVAESVKLVSAYCVPVMAGKVMVCAVCAEAKAVKNRQKNAVSDSRTA
jgi:hypothetical protein